MSAAAKTGDLDVVAMVDADVRDRTRMRTGGTTTGEEGEAVMVDVDAGSTVGIIGRAAEAGDTESPTRMAGVCVDESFARAVCSRVHRSSKVCTTRWAMVRGDAAAEVCPGKASDDARPDESIGRAAGDGHAGGPRVCA